MRIGTPKELIVMLLRMDMDKLYEIHEHKEKRTRSQNAYYWTLVAQIGDACHMPKPEVHNRLLRMHGRDLDLEICGERLGKYFPDTDETEETMLRLEEIHFRPTSKVKDGKRLWILLKGSHEMDTKEMSILVDGAVEEAKSLGIETLTPRELEELRQHEIQKQKGKGDGHSESGEGESLRAG